MSSVSALEPAESEGERPSHDAPLRWPAKRDVFGVGISPTNYQEASAAIVDAGSRRESKLVSAYAVHALVTFSGDKKLRSVANDFDMITPDGQPVRWALNLLHGAGLKQRVYGPHLTLHICEAAARQGVGIYLYGGTDEVLPRLKDALLKLYPDLIISGGEAPPFRPLTKEEDDAVVERINDSGAGIVFIGLGCPKQDLFAHAHRDRIHAVQVCVGAAFDFHAGAKPMAPVWMQKFALEWLYRLCQEPKRLWKRYLVTNSIYLWKLFGSMLGRILLRRGSEVGTEN